MSDYERPMPPFTEDEMEFVGVQEGRSRATSVFSVRFEGSQLREIIRAAREAGVKTGEFIRAAAIAAAEAQGDRILVEVDPTTNTARVVEKREPKGPSGGKRETG